MTYTAPEVLTIVAAVGALIAAVGVAAVNVIVAIRTTHKVEAAAQKTDQLMGKVDQVHTLTNSNLSAVKAELAAARGQITALVALVEDLRAQREKTSVLAALNTPAPRTGTEDRRADLKPQLDTIEELLDVKGEQIDNIETTVERVDKKVTPPRKLTKDPQ